jgi:hypothetical protein
MGTLENIEIGEVLTVRTYKVVPGVPLAWANTYEVVSNVAAEDIQLSQIRLNTLKNVIVDFERSLLCDNFIFDRIIISTYVPDGSPYNPFTFVSNAINAPGLYYLPGRKPLPLQFCALVKRLVSYGRLGNLLLRGIVYNEDVEITPSGPVIGQVRLNQIQNALDTFYNQLRTNDFDLVMARGSDVVETSTLRIVSGLSAKKDMRFKKLDNRYFDRLRS